MLLSLILRECLSFLFVFLLSVGLGIGEWGMG